MTHSVLVLAKSHVKTYTRKDGVVVQAHDDKRQKAMAPTSSSRVVKHADKSSASRWLDTNHESLLSRGFNQDAGGGGMSYTHPNTGKKVTVHHNLNSAEHGLHSKVETREAAAPSVAVHQHKSDADADAWQKKTTEGLKAGGHEWKGFDKDGAKWEHPNGTTTHVQHSLHSEKDGWHSKVVTSGIPAEHDTSSVKFKAGDKVKDSNGFVQTVSGTVGNYQVNYENGESDHPSKVIAHNDAPQARTAGSKKSTKPTSSDAETHKAKAAGHLNAAQAAEAAGENSSAEAHHAAYLAHHDAARSHLKKYGDAPSKTKEANKLSEIANKK